MERRNKNLDESEDQTPKVEEWDDSDDSDNSGNILDEECKESINV
jgi:hypothetical protein